MRRTIIGLAAAATLVLSACGGGGGGQQGEVADLMLEQAGVEGISLDPDCVREVAGKLSDDDAAKIIEAGVDGDVELSAEGDALGEEMFNCVDMSAIVDQIVEEMGGSEMVDADCLEEVIGDLSPEQMQAGEGMEGMAACIKMDG